MICLAFLDLLLVLESFYLVPPLLINSFHLLLLPPSNISALAISSSLMHHVLIVLAILIHIMEFVRLIVHQEHNSATGNAYPSPIIVLLVVIGMELLVYLINNVLQDNIGMALLAVLLLPLLVPQELSGMALLAAP